MTLEAIPLSGAMGAEIRGADLRDIDDETFADIHKILLDHGMIFFRDQDITPTQQLIFAKRWGEPHFHPYMPGLPDHPEIIEIVKNPEDTHTFGGQWHTATDRATLLADGEVHCAVDQSARVAVFGALLELADEVHFAERLFELLR